MRKPQFVDDGIRHATINGHRFHLRLNDPDKMNPLWIDGKSPPLLLDNIAAETFALVIDGMWKFQQGEGDKSNAVKDFVVDELLRKYRRIARVRISANVDRIFGTIMEVAGGTCPVNAGLASKEMKIANWAAPARMDLAITYRCNLNCPKCYLTDEQKKMDEMSTSDWTRIFGLLWKIGIPQVVFTGGEPTIRSDLVELISNAEEFVTGLITNGTYLSELAVSLKNASLDYAQVTLESHWPQIHNAMIGGSFDAFSKTVRGIEKALEAGIYVTTNTTLTKQNAHVFLDLLRFGKTLGLKNMACNTLICSGRGKAAKLANGLSLPEIERVLEDATMLAQELEINLEWYSPTCYLKLNPLGLGFGQKSCSAAAYNMTIQPDGTVLPCQSWPQTVGHIWDDPWHSIWNHPICQKLRNRQFLKKECIGCMYKETCGGGCPLDNEKGGRE